MARNALQRFTEKELWHRTEEWNPLAEELRLLIGSFVESLLSKNLIPDIFVDLTRHHLCWDIMLICFELEYRDMVDPFFSLPLLDPWYAAGHFPCGWDGKEFPAGWDGKIREGKLIVF
jgi:hypothetical protein